MKDTTYPILAFHQICKNFANSNMIDSLLFSYPQKIPSFYLVKRTITTVEVIVLHLAAVKLDLKYLVEFANCSSWMNSVYCHCLNEWAVFVSDLSLNAAIHKYIPSQVLNSKNGNANKGAWKAAIERYIFSCCKEVPVFTRNALFQVCF